MILAGSARPNSAFLQAAPKAAMRRRMTRKKHPPQREARKQAPEPFNPAFRDLAGIKDGITQESKKGAEKAEPVPRPTEDHDIQEFLEAMSDVAPLSGSNHRIAPLPNIHMRPAHSASDEELDALTHLYDLVNGTAEMDITFSDEFIEGYVRGFSRKLMQRFKKGRFSVQDYLDLHGLTKQEAEVKVRRFLLQSYQLGKRCVLIVHGRGLNSENHIPVLKERLPVWLMRGSVRKILLAFATARPYDGGSGAIYVLLKRQKAKTALTWGKGQGSIDGT